MKQIRYIDSARKNNYVSDLLNLNKNFKFWHNSIHKETNQYTMKFF